jgi:hypothetical protein
MQAFEVDVSCILNTLSFFRIICGELVMSVSLMFIVRLEVSNGHLSAPFLSLMCVGRN